MRATGFGFKSPKEHSGEYLLPMLKNDGRNLSMTHKTISEKRRERLFLHKTGLIGPVDQSNNIKSRSIREIESIPPSEAARLASSKELNEKQLQFIVNRKFNTFGKEGRFHYRDVSTVLLTANRIIDRSSTTSETERWGLAATTQIHFWISRAW